MAMILYNMSRIKAVPDNGTSYSVVLQHE